MPFDGKKSLSGGLRRFAAASERFHPLPPRRRNRHPGGMPRHRDHRLRPADVFLLLMLAGLASNILRLAR